MSESERIECELRDIERAFQARSGLWGIALTARNAAEAIADIKQRNRELTRQVEQLMATLERIGAMSVRFTCACGRPTGTGAIKSCADKALAALAAPPSSSDPGRADTKEERRIENELFAGDLYSGIKP